MENEVFTKELYNDIPVLYCEQCKSLKIMHSGYDFCGECGCTNIEETDIKSWEELYENLYGKKFLDIEEYFRKKKYNLSLMFL